jgi:hypothetical protein
MAAADSTLLIVRFPPRSRRSAARPLWLTVMITACIERGINTRGKIMGALRKKNFNEKRAGIFLTGQTGALWRRGSEGIYSLKDGLG